MKREIILRIFFSVPAYTVISAFLGGEKVETAFNLFRENAVFPAVEAAAEKHGAYDHLFCGCFVPLRMAERNGHSMGKDIDDMIYGSAESVPSER